MKHGEEAGAQTGIDTEMAMGRAGALGALGTGLGAGAAIRKLLQVSRAGKLQYNAMRELEELALS